MGIRQLKIRIRTFAGCLLSKLMPARTQKIKQAFALQYWGRGIGRGKVGRKIESLIRFYLAHSDKNQGEQLEQSYKHFWQNEIDEKWYVNSQKRFLEETLPALSHQIEALKSHLENTQIGTLCEIGTGDGMLLAHLKGSLSGVSRYVGLDLSEQRMAHNNSHFSGIEFIAADAFEWISQHSTDNTLYLTNGGVLEYFNPNSLSTLFQKIRTEQPNSIIALFHEPLAPNHNLETELESQLTEGGEYSFSHNYPNLLQLAGFNITYKAEEKHPTGYRAFTVFASAS